MPINGHYQTGRTGPFGANTRPFCRH